MDYVKCGLQEGFNEKIHYEFQDRQQPESLPSPTPVQWRMVAELSITAGKLVTLRFIEEYSIEPMICIDTQRFGQKSGSAS